MTGGPGPLYSPQAAAALDKLEADAAAGDLWNAVCDALDLILDRPGSAQARREALHTAAGTTIWKVPVRAPRETDDWVVLWAYGEHGRILITYTGVL
jgi:hypothetical protein